MRGDHDHPILMLQVVASQDLWFWHVFFGVAGSNNDINVLHQSPLFNDVLTGKTLACPFVANNVRYKYGYYLADEIYPEWTTFVKHFNLHKKISVKNSKKCKSRQGMPLNEL